MDTATIAPLFLGDTDAREQLTFDVDGTRHEIGLTSQNVLVTYGHIDVRTFKERAKALLLDLGCEGAEQIVVPDLHPVTDWALVGFDDDGETVIRWRDDRGVTAGGAERAPRVTEHTELAQPITFAAIWV